MWRPKNWYVIAEYSSFLPHFFRYSVLLGIQRINERKISFFQSLWTSGRTYSVCRIPEPWRRQSADRQYNEPTWWYIVYWHCTTQSDISGYCYTSPDIVGLWQRMRTPAAPPHHTPCPWPHNTTWLKLQRCKLNDIYLEFVHRFFGCESVLHFWKKMCSSISGSTTCADENAAFITIFAIIIFCTKFTIVCHWNYTYVCTKYTSVLNIDSKMAPMTEPYVLVK